MSTPSFVCETSGWNWMPKKRSFHCRATGTPSRLRPVTAQPSGEDADGVGVAHPDLRVAFEPVEDAVDPGLDHEGGGTIFARVSGRDLATELAVEQLHSVTNAEHGHAQLDEVIEIDVGCSGLAVERGPPERITAAGDPVSRNSSG
jgi:hypothetical protein